MSENSFINGHKIREGSFSLLRTDIFIKKGNAKLNV